MNHYKVAVIERVVKFYTIDAENEDNARFEHDAGNSYYSHEESLECYVDYIVEAE